MYISILGRQPALSLAELESVFDDVHQFSPEIATFKAVDPNVERLGGSLKLGRVVAELPNGDWRRVSMRLVKEYVSAWQSAAGKITLGISAYGFTVSARDVQKTGIILKKKLAEHNVSLRLIPNSEPVLSTATAHHNKLGLSDTKVELLVARNRHGKVIIAESIGTQNITALAARDQGRPKRDAFVGMLPPKLALLMLNLATGPRIRQRMSHHDEKLTVLDPFCGTGVVLQEAALSGFDVYGTDLAEKMVQYSKVNLTWLLETYHLKTTWKLAEADARTAKWQSPIDAVVCESYLGQPFSAPPSPAKLTEVMTTCNQIISEFLKNVHSQLEPGTPLCVAVPAWRSASGGFTHLPLVTSLGTLGYKVRGFKNLRPDELLYYREDQVVARELLVLEKA